MATEGDEENDAFGEEEKSQSGEEVFRGLYRLFPMANPHDYFKNGRWQVETMLVDTELLEAHRREASAPEPPPLEEVTLPDDMPKERVLPAYPARTPLSSLAPRPLTTTNGGTVRLSATAPATASIRPAPMKIKPVPGVSPAASTSAGASAKSPGPVATVRVSTTSHELEMIANFISTWELEASKAKLCLARLGAPRRRWVIDNYDGILSLEEFVAESASSNAWADAVPEPRPAARAQASQPTTPMRPVTIKRALTPSPGEYDASKRPRIGGSAYTPARPLGYSSSAPSFGASSYGAPPTNSRWPAYRPTAAAITQRAGTTYAAAKPAAYRPGSVSIRPAAYGSAVKRSPEARPGSMIGSLLR